MKLKIDSSKWVRNDKASPERVSRVIFSAGMELNVLIDLLVHLNKTSPERVLETVVALSPEIENIRSALDKYDMLTGEFLKT